MRRLLLAVLLATPGPAAAQVTRVSVEAPLTPALGNQTSVTPVTGLPSLPAPFALNPGLSAAAAFAPAPLASVAAVVPAAGKVSAFQAQAVSRRGFAPQARTFAGGSFVPASAAHAPDRVIESLKLHGAQSLKAAKLEGEAGSVAAERNFLSAAALDEGGVTGGESVPADGDSAARAALLERLLEKVTIDDGGKPAEREAMIKVFERMLASPSAQNFAKAFIDGGHTATVSFYDMPGSEVYQQDGRSYFSGTRALTGWNHDKKTVEVFLNRHYLQSDPAWLHDDLPPILAHELLGHGLWYSVMAPMNLVEAYALHEQHEQQARALGWIVDYELDRNFADAGAWGYLNDPGGYIDSIRLQLPMYATMLSGAEMAQPVTAYQARLSAAKERVSAAERNLANYRSWHPVIQYFIDKKGVKEERFTLLREEMGQYEKVLLARLETSLSVVKSLEEMIFFLQGPEAAGYLMYLKEASAHPHVAALEQDAANLGDALQKLVKEYPPVEHSASYQPAPERPKDQISWQEFQEMYEKDRADDRKKPRWLRYWAD